MRYVVAGSMSAAMLSFGSAMAWADESMTLDFVRHGASGDATVINTLVPGPGLTSDGYVQANDLVQTLGGNSYDGIYASTMIRSAETALPKPSIWGCP